MLTALASIIILQRATLQDVLKAQAAAGAVGLPVTAAEVAKFRPSEATKRSHAVIKSIVSVFKYPDPSNVPNPVQNIDWGRALIQLKPIAIQRDPLTIDDPKDLMTGFPGHANVKALLKATFAKAFDPRTTDSQRVELLSLCRTLMEHPTWNNNLIANLVIRAMQAQYSRSATNFAKKNPGWFLAHPELARPYIAPNFKAILRGEFIKTAYLVCGEFPMEKASKPAKDYDPKVMIVALKNWATVYPEAGKATNYTELCAAHAKVKSKLKTEKYDDRELDFTFPATLDTAKLDDGFKKWNAELAALLKPNPN